MNFIFSWQKQYERSEWVKYCFADSKIKFISSRHRVISSIYITGNPRIGADITLIQLTSHDIPRAISPSGELSWDQPSLWGKKCQKIEWTVYKRIGKRSKLSGHSSPSLRSPIFFRLSSYYATQLFLVSSRNAPPHKRPLVGRSVPWRL